MINIVAGPASPEALKPRPALIIFDLDGTLVDSAPDIGAAVGLALSDVGLPAPDIGQVRRMVGEGQRVLIERALRHAGGSPALLEDAQALRDLCASIQAAIVDVLVAKTMRAAERVGVRCVTASGGVACNRSLRQRLEEACRSRGFVLRLAEKRLSTDNAAMIGILAERRLLAGATPTGLDADIQPGWEL